MTTTERPTEPARNVQTHTGTVVHAGVWIRAQHSSRGWMESQACGKGRRAIAYGYPTDKPVTCKRCLGNAVP